MATANGKRVRFGDVGELLERLGNIPARRVCMDPLPGTATEDDLLRKHGRPVKLYELVEGTLVEKPMGRPESFVASELGRLLGNFVAERDLGFCTGPDDLIELMPKLVRGPDVCFIGWEKGAARTVDTDAISKRVPDLVVEVLSPSNSRGEMARKRKDYFFAGVRLVWEIDPRKRTAEAYTTPDAKTAIPAGGVLDGGDVLPGFRLPLAKLFEKFPAPTPAKKPAKSPKRKKK
jgi:Uma2 family endonuclease